MCEAMSSLGHEVTLNVRKAPAVTGQTFEGIRDFYGLQNEFTILPSPFSSKIPHSFASAFSTNFVGADLCYTRSAQAAFLTSSLGIPTVFEIHRPFATWMGRKLAHRIFTSPKITSVTISESLRAHCIRTYGITDRTKIITKHDGVKLDKFSQLPDKDALRDELSLDKGKYIICYTGNLYKRRGIDLMLNAATNLPEGAMLLIVGGSEEHIEEKQSLSKKLGCTNVRFEGYKPNSEIPKYLKAADVLAMPYELGAEDVKGSEIGDFMSPLKMFEYMASGTPIVASDLNVIKEVLFHESNAVLFEAGSQKSFEKSIKFVFENGEKANEIADRALSDVEDYTWEKRAASIIDSVKF